MAAVHDLIAQIGDERLRERKFGLVFEDHLPELLLLNQPAQLDALFDGAHQCSRRS